MFKWIIKDIKQLWRRRNCKHESLRCVTNLHGDQAEYYGCKSIWKCKNCGKRFKKDYRDENCNYDNFEWQEPTDPRK